MSATQTTLLTLLVAVISAATTALFLSDHDGQIPTITLADNPQNTRASANGAVALSDAENQRLLQSLTKQMAEIRVHINNLEQQNSAHARAEPANRDSVTPPQPPQAELEKQREAASQAQQALLENSLKRQSKDKAWVSGAQSKLSSAYSAAASKGVHFVDADCRSTMCQVKIELDQANKSSERELQNLMEKPAPWSGTRMMHMDRNSGTVTMYMMREGHSLPTLASATAQASR